MRAARLIAVACLLICVAACHSRKQSTPAGQRPGSAKLANPASVYCIEQGGKLEIRTGADGGEFGVCLFDEGRECEEWAMFRGECPVGGVKVTGCATPAAEFCLITGGEYTVTANSNTANEQGTCSFKNGKTCDVWDYYYGRCDSRSDTESPAASTRPHSEK
jgi:putative hemolysin